jgi:hypothetical protein
MTRTEAFTAKVERIVGPALAQLGFSLVAVDDEVDEGGRLGSVVYYMSTDCKLQLYWSARAGEINCMVAPKDAPDLLGLYDRSGKWHFLNAFVQKPALPLEELVKVLQSEPAQFATQESWLEWWRDRISRYLDEACAAIRTMRT